jgi:YidC/Oxa1 family membrane protein insertase
MGNKNTLIGILLISILIMLLMYNSAVKNQLKEQELAEKTEQIDTQEPAEQTTTPYSETSVSTPDETTQTTTSEGDSISAEDLALATLKTQYGAFAKFAQDSIDTYTLENELLRVEISNKGAQVTQVELKDFKTYDQKALLLIDNSQELSFGLVTADNKKIQTKDLYYQLHSFENNTLSLRLTLGDNQYIEKKYALTEDSYLVDFDVKFHNVREYLDSESDNLKAAWNYTALAQEQHLEREKQKSTIFWKTTNDEVEHLSTGASKNTVLSTPSEWISFKQQFFSSALLTKGIISKGELDSKIDLSDSSSVAVFYAKLDLDYVPTELENNYEMQFFFGPNNYRMLKKMGRGMHNTIELSYEFILFRWVKYISKWVIIPIFNGVEKVFSNYGIVILIMTLIIKMALMPLTFKSYVSTAKTKLLKPELEELRAKFKDDQQGYAAAQMQLYQKTGVSMFGGCLPMLLQMPFLLAMFYFFPSSIELRQQGFLWANDLSTYDNILNLPFTIPLYGSHVSLFTLLMTVSSILYARYNSQMQAQPTQPGMEMMKYMPYVFPFFLMFLFNSWPAALTYYYFLSNVISMGQQFVINKFFIDEDKLMKQIEENKLKTPKKKSGFAAKMEEIYKQQQDTQQKNKGK